MKSIAWIYCYMSGDKAVFLNKRDELIKEFDTYKECIEFAEQNIDLIK